VTLARTLPGNLVHHLGRRLKLAPPVPSGV
jgi:hypothetical protein